MKGAVSVIQRMSVDDGPGIRSTLFLKGCNFRCGWCHNPETWSPLPGLQQIPCKCIRCHTCAGVCPRGAIAVSDTGIVVDRSLCNACGLCANACPSGSLLMSGYVAEAADVVRELAEDRIFYDESGGGVTISGGEPFVQAAFVAEVLELCKAQGIATAVESNISCRPEIIRRVLPLVDLWMVDLKTMDDGVHLRHTGASNASTISNVRFLSESGAKLVVRTPVIPGVNDNEESIGDICRFLSGLKIMRYELLPFHTLGFDKYVQYGIRNDFAGVAPVGEKEIGALRKIVYRYGLNEEYGKV